MRFMRHEEIAKSYFLWRVTQVNSGTGGFKKKRDESVGMTLGLVNCMGETDVCIIGHNSENGRGDNRKRHISK